MIGVWAGGGGVLTAALVILYHNSGAANAVGTAALALLFLTPQFLVVYTLVWARFLSVRSRTAIVVLVGFATAVEAVSGWFWVFEDLPSPTTLSMRLLGVVAPFWFAAFVAWVLGRSPRQVGTGVRVTPTSECHRQPPVPPPAGTGTLEEAPAPGKDGTI